MRDASSNFVTETALIFRDQDTRNLSKLKVNGALPVVTIANVSWGDALNLTESSASGTISITTTDLEEGQVVQLSITNTATNQSNTYTSTITSGGAQIELDAVTLTSFVDSNTYSITAVASDLGGNASSVASVTFTVDRTVPQVLTSSNSWGSGLTIAESALSGVISITTTGASDGDNATLAIGGGSYTSTITSNAASFTVSSTYLTSLVDGSTVSYTVIVSDAVQNTSSTYSSTFNVDKFAPTISIASSLERLQVGQTAQLTFGVSKNSTDFNVNDVEVSYGALTDFATVDNLTYTASYTQPGTQESIVTFVIPFGVVQDLAGNSNTSTSTLSIALNSAPVGTPTPISVTQDDPDQVVTLTSGIIDPDGDEMTVTNFEVTYSLASGNEFVSVNDPVLLNKFAKIVSQEGLNGNELSIFTSKANFLSGINTGKIEISYNVTDGIYSVAVDNVILITGRNDAPSATDIVQTTTYKLDDSGNRVTDAQGNDVTEEIKEGVKVNSAVEGSDPDNGDEINYELGSAAGISNGSLVFNSDGTYTYTPNLHFYGSETFTYFIEDSFGVKIGPYVVTIQIAETPDDDGIPTVLESLGSSTDIDRDGMPDRKQNNVSHFPMSSYEAFKAAQEWALNPQGPAPASESFGAILIGDIGKPSEGFENGNYRSDPNAKLKDISILPKPSVVNENLAFSADLFKFAVVPQTGTSLTDLDGNPTNGLQTRVVLDLPKGINATTFIKKSPTGELIVFKDDQNLSTWDNGATLIDIDKDGLVDRIVITMTDNELGDFDPAVGKFLDPGGLGIVKPIINDSTAGPFNEGLLAGTVLFDVNENYSKNDFDLERDSLTYRLSTQNTELVLSALQIDSKSGKISVKNSEIFDFEAFVNSQGISTILVEVLVSDPFNYSDNATIAIKILNVNEIPTIITQTEVSFLEKQDVATVVVDIETLPDFQDVTTFTILDGKDSKAFNLEASTGKLRFNSSPIFGEKQEYRIDVKAVDVSGKIDQAEFTITIIGRDDDGDGVENAYDNCAEFNNPGQEDFDNDGIGDVCDLDDDNDGVLDIKEIEDQTDPKDPCSLVVENQTEQKGIQNWNTLDCDGDGVSNSNEIKLIVKGRAAGTVVISQDTDGDGIPDYMDTDDDGDGILTMAELPDSNGNGVPDDAVDTDGDGKPDYIDTDDDGDGILTKAELPDLDKDGIPDDAVDTDGDGIPDYIDTDDDGDGVPTRSELPDLNKDGIPDDAVDTDGDGIPDYIDTDDDGDGIMTNSESPDSNGDGIPDDAVDTDGDGTPDFRDLDNDGDLVPDVVEIQDGTNPTNSQDYKDVDEDDVPDYVENLQVTDVNDPWKFLDSDGDGVPEYVEMVEQTKDSAASEFKDSDMDGVPDYVQIRSVQLSLIEELVLVWGEKNYSSQFPTEVEGVTFSGKKITLKVVWDKIESVNIFKRGTYMLTGKLVVPKGYYNPYKVNGILRVIVLPKPAPRDVTIDNSTFEGSTSVFFIGVGAFAVNDPVDNIHVVSLFGDGYDNKFFSITDNVLYWNSAERAPGKVTFSIVVRVTDRDGNTIEKFFEITRTRQSLNEVVIYNTFTPDGDRFNDAWGVPEVRFYEGARISVYDRGGGRVFYTENPDVRWDGSNNGKEMPVGSYYWIIELKETGETRRGIVNLIRK